MSNVTLELGGRAFTIACADGQEAHILGLGRAIDEKLATMPNLANQSESRMLLFAALLVADELHQARQKLAKASATPDTPVVPSSEVAEVLEKIAETLESCAQRLEKPDANP